MNLIFDIGYNKGLFAKECLRLYPNCKIVGVDANKKLISSNNTNKNVILIHGVVSNKANEEQDFYIDHTQPGISTASKKFLADSRFAKGSLNLLPNSGRWETPVKIKTTTLDNLIKYFGVPDLIKIDVEGYEPEVIQGLNKKANTICFEWHEEDLDGLTCCVEHLISLGYSKFGIIGYFAEEKFSEKMTYNEKGDPYMVEPDRYFTWPELLNDLKNICDCNRRINYGMMFAKE
jgi:hypothetical protein